MGKLLIFLVITILVISIGCLIGFLVKHYNSDTSNYQKQINDLKDTVEKQKKIIRDMQLKQKRKELNDKIHNKEIKNT